MERTLFFDHCGPLIKYTRDGLGEWLTVDDLNPQTHVEFKLTPWELLRFGFKCIWAAVTASWKWSGASDQHSP